MCINILYNCTSILGHVCLIQSPTFSGDWNSMFPSSPMDLYHSSFNFFINFFYSLLTDSFVFFFFLCFLSFAYFLGFGDITCGRTSCAKG